jgi:hypothetical protein
MLFNAEVLAAIEATIGAAVLGLGLALGSDNGVDSPPAKRHRSVKVDG